MHMANMWPRQDSYPEQFFSPQMTDHTLCEGRFYWFN